MEIDDRFATKLPSVQDAPEPFRSALADSISPQESIRLLIHAPPFSTLGERTFATVLAVTDKGWLLVSETEDGGTHVEKSDFGDTLFLELASILLSGQFKIHFAKVGTSYSATTTFDTVEERLYREAIDLILNGIDPNLSHRTEEYPELDKLFDSWPIKFRAEAQRYRPKGQPLLAAIHWPVIFGGYSRELCPAAALLITSRELVLISEEKTSPRQHVGDDYTFGAIITYFPVVRLEDFHVGHEERFGVLELRVHARHGGEKLEIIFPADRERAVSKAMEQVLIHAAP
jgi:hypothetical protein